MNKEMLEKKIAEGNESLKRYDGLELSLEGKDEEKDEEKDTVIGGFNLIRKKKKDDEPYFTFR